MVNRTLLGLFFLCFAHLSHTQVVHYVGMFDTSDSTTLNILEKDHDLASKFFSCSNANNYARFFKHSATGSDFTLEQFKKFVASIEFEVNQSPKRTHSIFVYISSHGRQIEKKDARKFRESEFPVIIFKDAVVSLESLAKQLKSISGIDNLIVIGNMCNTKGDTPFLKKNEELRNPPIPVRELPKLPNGFTRDSFGIKEVNKNCGNEWKVTKHKKTRFTSFFFGNLLWKNKMLIVGSSEKGQPAYFLPDTGDNSKAGSLLTLIFFDLLESVILKGDYERGYSYGTKWYGGDIVCILKELQEEVMKASSNFDEGVQKPFWKIESLSKN